MSTQLTHEDLRKWGESLDKESRNSLGKRLILYADHWRAEITAEREACCDLHDSANVLAPVLPGTWGEAYQEGWAAGTAAYRNAILARKGR